MKHYRVVLVLSVIFMVIALCGCGTAKKLESARNSIASGEYSAALEILESVNESDERNALIEECNKLIECDSKYNEALSLVEKYKYLEAADLFSEIQEYKDSSEQLKKAKYQYAFEALDYEDLNKSHNKDRAFSILEELGTYNNSDQLLLEKKYQYAGDYSKKYKNGIDEVYKFYIEHLEYKDCLELYTNYVSEKVSQIIEGKGNARVIKEALEELKAEIPEGYASIDEAFTVATIEGIDYLIEQGKVEKARQVGEVIADSDYPGAKEKAEEAVNAYNLMLEETAKIAESRQASSGGKNNTQGGGSSNSNASLTMNAIGTTYSDANGLSVTLNSFQKNETEGYIEYSISYTLSNSVPDSKIMEGSFKLFFTDNTGEPQYGSFNYLYYGDSVSRNYTWKVLKSQEVLTLEYNADDPNAGLNGAFFRNKPVASSFHWSSP